MARLKDLYKQEIAPKLQSELGLDNVMEIPRLSKITLNMGVGEAIGDKKILQNAVANLRNCRTKSYCDSCKKINCRF